MFKIMAEIQLEVEDQQIESLTRRQRVELLGNLAADQIEGSLPLPAGRAPSAGWSGHYDEQSIIDAFHAWAASHDGLAPSKKDWSKAGDPDRRWPRAERVCVVASKVAETCGVHTSRWAPHEDEAREVALLKEAGGILDRNGKVHADLGDLDYCKDCVHGPGCMPPDKSPWEFAVEDMGGLSVRRGSDMNSTPSGLPAHGRNRQMVTAGQADVHPSPSDPAAREIIETISPKG